MEDPLEGSKRKIARAEEHIEDLEREIKLFVNKNPYKQVIEPDPDRPHQTLYKIKLTEPIPGSFANIVGDVVNNLRSALDQAVYAIALASGIQSPKEAYFPFARTAADFERNLKGRCKDVPQDIWPLFRSFEPYKGGNEVLWTLNEMCTTDKHKMLIPLGTGAAFGPGLDLSGTGFFELYTNPIWDRTKQELVYLRLGPESKFDYKIRFILYIAFNDIAAIDGEPVRAILDQTLGEIRRILLSIEAEGTRLGIFK